VMCWAFAENTNPKMPDNWSDHRPMSVDCPSRQLLCRSIMHSVRQKCERHGASSRMEDVWEATCRLTAAAAAAGEITPSCSARHKTIVSRQQVRPNESEMDAAYKISRPITWGPHTWTCTRNTSEYAWQLLSLQRLVLSSLSSVVILRIF